MFSHSLLNSCQALALAENDHLQNMSSVTMSDPRRFQLKQETVAAPGGPALPSNPASAGTPNTETPNKRKRGDSVKKTGREPGEKRNGDDAPKRAKKSLAQFEFFTICVFLVMGPYL